MDDISEVKGSIEFDNSESMISFAVQILGKVPLTDLQDDKNFGQLVRMVTTPCKPLSADD